MLRLHDTALGRVVDVEPREPGKLSMYVCGGTVYDVPHIGHGRFALVWDVLRRYVEWRGLEVRYVSNVTDVDDKIILRARDEGRSSEDVAREFEDAWWSAMERLDVRRPDEAPRATEFIDRMVELIAELERRGFAYEIDDGVYFASEKVDGYGLLARQSLDSLRAGARVAVDEAKRSPVDFALWKKAKPGEPSWPSPWGEGRPGWHTECVVMSLDLLGDDFDLHGGGQDLAFPHHENERAQAVALGHPFARHWVHSGLVVAAGGEKMSKSLGNFTSLDDLLAKTDGRAYRLLVLQASYRSPLQVTPETIANAEAALRGLDNFVRRTAELDAARPDPAIVDQFVARMDDDFDTPGAIAVAFDAARRGNAALDAGDRVAAATYAATVRELLGAVGLELGRGDDVVADDVAQRVAARDAARAAHDWATADAIRAELEAAGWVVEDTPTGTKVHR